MSIDRLIVEFDKALRAVFAPAPTRRSVPGVEVSTPELSLEERRHAAALMRVNHCGEICAQALYQGQALISKNAEIKGALEHAAWEETEHLAWTEKRIQELGGRKSALNPLWYVGSLALGVAAGRAGDSWNLGFLAETERQVERHLDSHLQRLPLADRRSRSIVSQMKLDEISHAQTAVSLGGVDLPGPVRLAMKLSSKVMTGVAYYI